MLAPRKQNRLVAGVLWALRALVVVGGGYVLYNGWFNLDAEKLANVVTVLTAVMAVWALFDRTFLDWIVRKVRRAWERVRPRPRDGVQTIVSPIVTPKNEGAPSKPASGAPREHVDHETTSEEAKEEIVDPTVGCGFGIFVALVAAILFGALTFGPQLWDAIFPPTPVGGEEAPPPPPPPPSPTPPPAPIKYLVKEGDSCWAIANACTGDSDRLDELGPPLNPIDVKHPRCPIRAGGTINLPSDWTECPPA